MFDNRNTRPRKHVALRLGDRKFAFDMLSVQEIVYSPALEPCLDGSEFLVGMFASSRGPVPVLDLLGRPPDVCPVREMSLVILQISDKPICLIVDDLLDVIEFDPSEILPVPDGAYGVPDELLRGVIEITQSDYYLLDLDRIVDAFLGSVTQSPDAGEGGPDQ